MPGKRVSRASNSVKGAKSLRVFYAAMGACLLGMEGGNEYKVRR
jgi:hypothetical protein